LVLASGTGKNFPREPEETSFPGQEIEMGLQMFGALPAYAGGKRRLLGALFHDVPSPAEAPVFVDPFLGGGSVSLCAKARGYAVVCNDCADRSVIVGKALIENDRVLLGYDDLVRLFTTTDGGPGYAERELCPDTFALRHARFLDLALANAKKLAGPKRWLSLLLVIKYALRMRPMGNFGARTIIHQVEDGDWEQMNLAYVKDIFGRGMPYHPMRVAEPIRHAINQGVFSNGHLNRCEQKDVFEFLAGVRGDVAYFDPPYAATQSYERASKPLDDLLRGEFVPVEPSAFTTERPEKILPRLFEAADHIPLWVVSYGNQLIGLGELRDLVRRFRPKVSGREIRHVHCSGLASAESRERNRELLVVGRKA
jgi:adenine-specific DNA-methyltransferase